MESALWAMRMRDVKGAASHKATVRRKGQKVLREKPRGRKAALGRGFVVTAGAVRKKARMAELAILIAFHTMNGFTVRAPAGLLLFWIWHGISGKHSTTRPRECARKMWPEKASGAHTGAECCAACRNTLNSANPCTLSLKRPLATRKAGVAATDALRRACHKKSW